MRLLLLSFVLGSLCLAGCVKSKPAPPAFTPADPPAPAPSMEAPAPPTDAPPAPSLAAPPSPDSPEPKEEPSITALNEAVNAYIMGELKEPKSLEDLVKAGVIKRLPTPPPGKKFALNANRTQVILVNK
jgi:hypothetical protein